MHALWGYDRNAKYMSCGFMTEMQSACVVGLRQRFKVHAFWSNDRDTKFMRCGVMAEMQSASVVGL